MTAQSLRRHGYSARATTGGVLVRSLLELGLISFVVLGSYVFRRLSARR